MILELLFNLVFSLLNIAFSWVSFPQMPQAVSGMIDTLFGYMSAGMGFVWLMIPRELVLVLLPIVLVVENFDRLYKIVMWILKKIPFLNMG